jgi:hypothetical protein
VIVVVGVFMVLLGRDAASAVGVSFLVLGVLGLVTGGGGLLAERVLARRPPPSAAPRQGDSRGPRGRIVSRNGRRALRNRNGRSMWTLRPFRHKRRSRSGRGAAAPASGAAQVRARSAAARAS